MAPSVTMYAEHLLNIRQVTIFATLESESNHETRAELSSDRRSLSLTHDGETATIRLPSEIAGSASLTLPMAKSKVLSFRLQVTEDVATLDRPHLRHGNDVPWPAASLSCETSVACRECQNIVVKSPSLVTWKDLPSENWAEMMDFWHCHKPADHEAHVADTPSTMKGYAASNAVRASPGTGLVDLSYLLICEQDCSNIQRREGSLKCAQCDSELGLEDTQAEGLRLFKWSVCLQRLRSTSWESFPVQSFVCAQLLALLDVQSTRKFIAYSRALRDTKSALLLWIFTPDLHYSSSLLPGEPKRAMKILYETVSNPLEILERQSLAVDELRLPDHIVQAIRGNLEASNALLPMSARKLQSWNIGLLDRFESSSHVLWKEYRPA